MICSITKFVYACVYTGWAKKERGPVDILAYPENITQYKQVISIYYFYIC